MIKQLSKIPKKGFARLGKLCHQWRQGFIYSRTEKRSEHHGGPLSRFVDPKTLNLENISQNVGRHLTVRYLEHSFDLLGSGWTIVDYSLKARGLEGICFQMNGHIPETDSDGKWLAAIVNPKHLPVSKQIWKKISRDYKPIDWQLDFKSGFRWDARIPAYKQRARWQRGADIKVPWELARMQHMPRLATFAMLLPEYREKILLEFRNQTLDFIMANPVCMGVNWVCAMDVGIRAANLLLAYDLLRPLDTKGVLGEGFNKVLASSIFAHGDFIVKNLEWNPSGSKNHYLANIAGLLWIAAYSGSTESADLWLLFAVQELIDEVCRQFQEDGSHFEASTSYHRLCGEMVVYSVALLNRVLNSERARAFRQCHGGKVPRLRPLAQQKFSLDREGFLPKAFVDRLRRMGDFTSALSRPDGRVFQIGDNDSGRFFKISPCGKMVPTSDMIASYENLRGYSNEQLLYWNEDDLDHRSFLAASSGLFTSNCYPESTNEYPLEHSLIEGLSMGLHFGGIELGLSGPVEPGMPQKTSVLIPSDKEFFFSSQTTISLRDFGLGTVGDYSVSFFRDFGVCVFRAPEVILIVHAGSPYSICGHAHNDRGSFQLHVNGRDIYSDRGTYLYTPLPERRDEFRSVWAHNVPIVEAFEQNRLEAPFRLQNDSQCAFLSLDAFGLTMHLTYGKVKHIRTFQISNEEIIISDSSNREFIKNFIDAEKHSISDGYGKLRIPKVSTNSFEEANFFKYF